MEYIRGEDRNQVQMLPDSIEEYVSEENAVRVIDAYINSLNMQELGFKNAGPNDTGRPMYDRRDLLKLYVYGYMNRVRSSRRLETETKRNLEVIWLLRKLSPDHKTIARFRHDNSVALKNVFRDFVKLCMKLDLYGKELIAVDGSKFKAVNSKDRNFGEKKLKERIARLDAKIADYLQELDVVDTEERPASAEKTSAEITKIVSELSERKSRYESYAEELENGEVLQKSLTDSDSRLMMANGKMDVCYNIQSAVDSKNKMIAEFEVTNHVLDKNMLLDMSAKSVEILETDTLTVVADAGYNSASDIAGCLRGGVNVPVAGAKIDICVPAEENDLCEITSYKNGRTVYIPERNIALCPMGNVLYPHYYKKRNKKAIFYNCKACTACSCKCVSGKYYRFEIDIPEKGFTTHYDDENLKVMQVRVVPDAKIIKARKSIVEHPFGTIKRNMDSGYCLTKGLVQVGGEFSLAFLAYNLKRAINILGYRRLIQAIQA